MAFLPLTGWENLSLQKRYLLVGFESPNSVVALLRLPSVAKLGEKSTINRLYGV